MVTALGTGKAKFARRVLEVFEFFDKTSPTATVMDIVRRYDRPQSSTSELLTNLAEMGLLYKDAETRSYSPTPRLAILGFAAQPNIIRDGRLIAFMDRLARSTGHGVALFGWVSTYAQIFYWSAGANLPGCQVKSGDSVPLSASAVGLLFLSTMDADQSGRLIRRLKAELPAEDEFNPIEIGNKVEASRRQGFASGPAGFVPDATVTAMLLPRSKGERPLALGMIYPSDVTIDVEAVVRVLERGVAACHPPKEDNLPECRSRRHAWQTE